MMSQVLENVIDDILQKPTFQEMLDNLHQLQQLDQHLFQTTLPELKIILSNQFNISFHQLQLLQHLVSQENSLNAANFKVPSIYHLVAVVKGCLQANIAKQQMRTPFLRNLKKQTQFWGLQELENLNSALIHNQPRPIVVITEQELRKKEYLWEYICSHLDMFPSNFDIYQYVFKHLLMLKPQNKSDNQLFLALQKTFFNYPYHYQLISKNFRFAIEFFRNYFNEKQCGFHPQVSISTLLKNYKVYQIDNMLSVASLGLQWGGKELGNCISNCFKLGVTNHTYILLKSFVQLGKRLKKYQELVSIYETNLTKPFIFMKHEQLFGGSLKFLKEFVLGPWPITQHFNILTGKIQEFEKHINEVNRKDFLNFVECVIDKYEQTTITDELKNMINRHKGSNYVMLEKEEIRKLTNEYDWRAFESENKVVKTESTSASNTYRGLQNIGNSCYMNSFLQCLFLTKELRKNILKASTLQLEKKVLDKYREMHKETQSKNNLPVMARESVRPVAQVQRTFSLLLKSKRTIINPVNIKKISPVQFQNVFQHDSIEFGRSLLQLICRSSLQNIFEGKTLTEIQCGNCQEKRYNKEGFLDLMLSSETDSETIENLVANSMKEQVIENLRCDKCQMICEKSIKRHWIQQFPKYLILTLKRFEYDIKENKNYKKKFKLQLEDEFKIQEKSYILYGIIVHRGTSANSGHYFSFCRENYLVEEKRWLCLNDSEVSVLEEFGKVRDFLEINTEDTPYILFAYEKQYMEKHGKEIQEGIILRAPLQSYIEKDDLEYINSISKRKTLDLSGLKFNTGTYKRDEDDEGDGGMMGFHQNNPIV